MPSVTQVIATLFVGGGGAAIIRIIELAAKRMSDKATNQTTKEISANTVQIELSRQLAEAQGGSLTRLWVRLDEKDKRIDELEREIETLRTHANELAPAAARVPELEARLRAVEARFRDHVRDCTRLFSGIRDQVAKGANMGESEDAVRTIMRLAEEARLLVVLDEGEWPPKPMLQDRRNRLKDVTPRPDDQSEPSD